MNPALQAHLRLLSILPVRTHEFVPRESEPFVVGPRTLEKKLRIGKHVYFNVAAASKALNKGDSTIYRWLASGKAKFL